MITTFPSLKIDIEKFPAVKAHLLSFGHDRLKQTGEQGARKKTNNQWFETQDSITYWEDFYKQKIVWGEISDSAKFAFDGDGNFLLNTIFFMVGGNLKYLLALLNSNLGEWLFHQTGTTTGGGTNRWLKYTLEQFLAKEPMDQEREKIEKQTDVVTHSPTQENISTLDRLIYELYGLSTEEQEYLDLRQNSF